MATHHTVVAGDTLWDLAVKFYGDGSMYPLIAQANKVSNPNVISVGQELVIPPRPEPLEAPEGSRRHRVVAGDTLWDLAVRFYGDGTLYPLIAQANRIPNPNLILVGQRLIIPPLPGTSEGEEGGNTHPVKPKKPRTAKGTFPYASEPFGVYQPLIGWRSRINGERLSDGVALRFNKAVSLAAEVFGTSESGPIILHDQAVGPRRTDRTHTQVGRALISRIGDEDAVGEMLRSGEDSPLAEITTEVVAALRSATTAVASGSFTGTSDGVVGSSGGGTGEVSAAAGHPSATDAAVEATTAALLKTLEHRAPGAADLLFAPAMAPWQRAMAAIEWFAQQNPSQALFLSPIGLLHRFREYFFEMDTFVGPPVGHVWLSPGGTVELVEVNTRRTLVERSVEQSTSVITRSESEAKEQDELSNAVKIENANDMKLGVSTAASGGLGSVFQASGSASFNLDNSRKQAQEDTHKHMREQSSKLSSEVRQDYKTTFRTVTETTDTSSRRYVLQNTTKKLVSYELSRKMRRVTVQVQDLGQQLCWQMFVDKPGDPLRLGEFVHETADALDPVKPPDQIPRPGNQEKVFQFSIPFILYQGADDEAENTYTLSSDHGDHGIFVPDVGTDDIIQFKFDFQLPPAPTGTVLASITRVDFRGAQVKFETENPNLQPNPNPAKNSFSIRLTHANFGGKHQIPFEVTVVYAPTPEAVKAVDDANAAAKTVYDAEVDARKEAAFYTTLRKRLKLAGQVRTRNPEDLREEERSIIFRAVISRLYGKDSTWNDEDYHVASELIRYFFDVDAMLYFVAPDWWRPRFQRLPSMNNQSPLVPSTIVDLGPSIGRYRPHQQHYLITEETVPAPMGASLGWLIQLDGDANRNAFLNSPWVKAVLPIRPGRERDAITWLRRPEVAGGDGLMEPYPFDSSSDPEEYKDKTIEQVLLLIADKIAAQHQESLQPVPISDDVGPNQKVALPTETVFAAGFDPLGAGIKFGEKPFQVFSQWTEILPTDQVVAMEYATEDD